MTMNDARSKGLGRVAVSAILSLWIVGCGGVQTQPAEPEPAAPAISVAPASVAPPTGQELVETIKTLLSDRRAKPVALGAGGLLAAILLAVGLGKVLRGDAPEAGPVRNGSARQA